MFYLWIKVLHLVALISWFAGLFYLPRLFVYYAENEEPQIRKVLLIMQQRLWKIIMLPAALLTALFGFILLFLTWEKNLFQSWIHLKGALLFLLYGYHFYLRSILTGFQNGENPKPGKYYRILNEVPTVALILIVILAVIKPWSR